MASSLEKTVGEIKHFKVQGANQIAIHGMKFLRAFAKKNGFKLKWETAAYFLEEARPTAVVLHNCVERIKKSRKISTIDRLIKHLETVGEKEGRYADRIVKKNSRIMTYCHSGEAMAFIKHAWRRHKKRISVIAAETEPLEQGVRTAKELSAIGIPVTLIDDNAIGFFMREVDIVILGSDSLRAEGSVNKIGTSMVAQAAKSNRKPFYIVANTLKIDKRKKFIIEERSPKEIYRKLIHKRNMKKIKIRNPAFDVTPWKNVTAVVTEVGVMRPSSLVRRFL